MNTSPFMDKQIMDLSASGSAAGSSPPSKAATTTHHFMAPQDDDDDQSHVTDSGNTDVKNDEILPNYDFQPLRPLGYAQNQNLNLDSANVSGDGSVRVWNSVDLKANVNSTATTTLRSYGSVDSVEPAKVSVKKDRNVLDATVVSEIDRIMKKHADDLLYSLEGISARLTQLETRTRHLENSVDDLQVTAGNNHGSTDGKMRQLENILREVHSSVRCIRDNQDKFEAQLHLAKLQISKPDQHSEMQHTLHTDNVQQTATSQQPLAPQALPALPAFPSSFASHHLEPNHPPPPPQQQNLQPQVPNQYPQNQIPSVPQRDPYYQPHGPPQEPQPQQYLLPPTQQPQPQLPPQVAPPPHQQYQPAVHQQYSQPPPQPAQQLPSFSPANPPQPQLSLAHLPDEMPYPPSQSYPPSVRQHPSQSTNSAPPSQQFYGAPSHQYEPPSGRASSGFSSGYGPQTGSNEPYSFSGPPSQYGGSSTLKPQGSGSGSGGYPQLPTARLLPQALPTASAAIAGSGSAGTGNRVPVDDVVDKVTTMGFPRDVVRATVRKLTENGQAVDLNIVLDKLMNDGDIQQPPKGWFGR